MVNKLLNNVCFFFSDCVYGHQNCPGLMQNGLSIHVWQYSLLRREYLSYEWNGQIGQGCG